MAAKGATGASVGPAGVGATKGVASQLPPQELAYRSPGEVLHDHLSGLMSSLQAKGLSREESLVALFPKTVLPYETYEDTMAALLSGAHLLFFGPSGSGKTNLAKELWDLFPKSAWVVDGCPLMDHPGSVVDPVASEEYPPCPVCARRFSTDGTPEGFDAKRVDPSKVPVRRISLREGFGFARIQGSSEVFPDHLTGNINLLKLEQVGDPMSPLVLEPGKLLQANRGFLLVDEIGKLPLGTQNVLLQALQEGTVTPAKSRESFPSRFVAVCTSNLSDLDNINDPLSDRLTSLHVGFNLRHADNRRIVELGRAEAPGTFVPEILVDAGVRVIESWRLRMSDENPDIGEVGSNRTLLDVAARAAAISALDGRSAATSADLRAGLLHAMRGRIRARSGDSFRQNERRVVEFVDQYLPAALKRSAGVYWCRYYRGPLKENAADAEALVGEGRRLKDDAALRAQLAGDSSLFPRFRAFGRFVGERERLGAGTEPSDAAATVFRLLEEFSLFSCSEEDDDDAPLAA